MTRLWVVLINELLPNPVESEVSIRRRGAVCRIVCDVKHGDRETLLGQNRAAAWVGALIAVSGCGPSGPCNGSLALCERPFNQVAFAGTHNSMSNAADGWMLPNQQHGIDQQLDDGVRVFLMDTFAWEDGFGCVTSPAIWAASP